MEKILKYKIVGRYMRGVEVVGYHVVDSMGKDMPLDKEAVQQMALDNVIVNCKAQLDNGEVRIKGVGCKLRELPVIDVDTNKIRGSESNRKNRAIFTIVARIFEGKGIIGYVIRDGEGVDRKVRRSDVFKLAEAGKITNARVQMDRGNILLRGVNCDLAQLPTLRA